MRGLPMEISEVPCISVLSTCLQLSNLIQGYDGDCVFSYENSETGYYPIYVIRLESWFDCIEYYMAS